MYGGLVAALHGECVRCEEGLRIVATTEMRSGSNLSGVSDPSCSRVTVV
jgi:hypothetical protein